MKDISPISLETRRWLDSKELRRCEPCSRGILLDLMCIANEGVPRGHLADKVGPLTDEYMASRCVVPVLRFRRALLDLVRNNRVHQTGKTYFVPQMVDQVWLKEYRATTPHIAPVAPNGHAAQLPLTGTPEAPEKANGRGTRLSVATIPQEWLLWSVSSQGWTREHTLTVFDDFHDYWVACVGKKGEKADWPATWRMWCKRTRGVANKNGYHRPSASDGLDEIINERRH